MRFILWNNATINFLRLKVKISPNRTFDLLSNVKCHANVTKITNLCVRCNN